MGNGANSMRLYTAETRAMPQNSRNANGSDMRDVFSRNNTVTQLTREENESTLDRVRRDYDVQLDDLESQIREKERQNSDYIHELETALDEKDCTVEKLERDLATERNVNKELQNKLSKLTADYDALKEDFDERSKMTESIRTEASTLFQDVRTLTDKNRVLKQERDDFESQVEDLRGQLGLNRTRRPSETSLRKNSVNSQGSRSARTDGPLSASAINIDTFRGRATSIHTNGSRRSASSDRMELSFDEAFVALEKSIDQVIEVSRNGQASAVLTPMKMILAACRSITEYTEEVEIRPATTMRDRKTLQELSDKLSDSLTQLINASKDHASKATTKSSDIIEDEALLLRDCVHDLVDVIKSLNRASQVSSRRSNTILSAGSRRSQDTRRSNAHSDSGSRLDSAHQSFMNQSETMRRKRQTLLPMNPEELRVIYSHTIVTRSLVLIRICLGIPGRTNGCDCLYNPRLVAADARPQKHRQ